MFPDESKWDRDQETGPVCLTAPPERNQPLEPDLGSPPVWHQLTSPVLVWLTANTSLRHAEQSKPLQVHIRILDTVLQYSN